MNSQKKSFKLWKRHLSDKRLKEFIAEKHQESTLLRKYLISWHKGPKDSWLKSYFERRIMSRLFYHWMEETLKSVKKNQTSTDFCDFKLTLNAFERWCDQAIERDRLVKFK